jgi:hypothetical protein
MSSILDNDPYWMHVASLAAALALWLDKKDKSYVCPQVLLWVCG